MRRPSRTGDRLRIGRLDLDLRGIAAGTAEVAARALGPALARALTSRSPDEGFGTRDSRFDPADRIDAGRIESPASPEAHDVAARIAQRIAHVLQREER